MSTQCFATIGVRLLGVAAMAIGIVFAGSSGVMHALGTTSVTNVPTADLHLHDTYHVVSHVEYAWLIPGLVSGITGILLLAASRRLGALLACETESVSSIR